ncbi:hypothetical protein QF044_001049 [Chryseobacterium sp. W4I1]|nr:hypothetical protein [Chryseobacterium sp. W4I1]
MNRLKLLFFSISILFSSVIWGQVTNVTVSGIVKSKTDQSFFTLCKYHC